MGTAGCRTQSPELEFFTSHTTPNAATIAAREALGLSPLVQARWADPTCIKGVPLKDTSAEPVVFLAGRPTAERAMGAEHTAPRGNQAWASPVR